MSRALRLSALYVAAVFALAWGLNGCRIPNSEPAPVGGYID